MAVSEGRSEPEGTGNPSAAPILTMCDFESRVPGTGARLAGRAPLTIPGLLLYVVAKRRGQVLSGSRNSGSIGRHLARPVGSGCPHWSWPARPRGEAGRSRRDRRRSFAGMVAVPISPPSASVPSVLVSIPPAPAMKFYSFCAMAVPRLVAEDQEHVDKVLPLLGELPVCASWLSSTTATCSATPIRP